ncbi:MAG: hypothetical protein WAW37_07420, partial [Syntrophobacteraceae bacterium]
MNSRPGGKMSEKDGRNYLFGAAILIATMAVFVILPGPGGHEVVNAASACAACHADGRTGTPPATSTHISAGLV